MFGRVGTQVEMVGHDRNVSCSEATVAADVTSTLQDDMSESNRSVENREATPTSEEAKEQGRTGLSGSQAPGGEAEKQPAQSSNRRGARHEEGPEIRTGFEAGQAPSEQGDLSDPSPERIKQNQQGMKAAGPRREDRSQEEAVKGEPRSEHTRGNRQSVSGDRNQDQ